MKLSDYKINDLQGKKVLITGASSGIGRAIAEFLGQKGAILNLVARREDKLKEILNDYKGDYVCGDINEPSTFKLMLEKKFFDVDIVINNAGLALGKGGLVDTEDDDIDLMIQTNITSALKIVKESLKQMKQNKGGDIVNITSIASHEAYAGGSVYCATKHALLASAKASRHDTLGENIRILNISPGMVETEFSKVRFKGDEQKAQKVYQGMRPLSPYDIAWQTINALETPRHVNTDEIIVLALDQVGATKRV